MQFIYRQLFKYIVTYFESGLAPTAETIIFEVMYATSDDALRAQFEYQKPEFEITNIQLVDVIDFADDF